MGGTDAPVKKNSTSYIKSSFKNFPLRFRGQKSGDSKEGSQNSITSPNSQAGQSEDPAEETETVTVATNKVIISDCH